MAATPETLVDEDSSRPDSWIGRTLLGRYEVKRLIATGGMGRVYAGVQRALNRPIALKRVHPHLLTAPGIVTRFMSEARVVSALTHPNIVRVFDFGRTDLEEGGDLFLVMELLEGIDLAMTLAAPDPPPLAWSIDVLLQTLSALEEAHAHGVTHRDIKPENLFLTSTRTGKTVVKLIDFGIAKTENPNARASLNEMVGTPQYMAPELIRGEEPSASVDLYAVGVVSYLMLTGKQLFDGQNVPEILNRQLTQHRPDPRTVAPDRSIPEELAALCLKAVSLDKADRYQSAEEMSEALRHALRGASLSPAAGASFVPRPPGVTETGRFTGRPADPANRMPSARYTRVNKRTDFASLHELDRQVASAFAAGETQRGETLLEDGVERARLLSQHGDVDLAAIAWRSFAGRLAAAWQCSGRLGDALSLVREALHHVGHDAFAAEKLRDDLARLSQEATQVARASGVDLKARARADGLERAPPEPHLVKPKTNDE